ncbi:hypothetical protein ACFJGV_09155 [Cnuibacter sp. UC19_7]|uniref:hypothetical protein n=1 Tax=Cnuibacter sp. UC19_7 TaxID=3350166 RepID=UPI00366FFDA9
MKVVAVATVAVAVAALAGFAVKAPELAAAAGSIHAPVAEPERAGSVTASWQERSVGATGGWATSAWIDSLQPVVAADEGFASDGARTALAAGVTGLGGAAASSSRSSTATATTTATAAVLAGVAASDASAARPLAAALRHGVEVKALIAAAKVSLEQVRVEVVARAQAVLDAETPDADAASRDALAAALAAPALAAPAPAAGGSSRPTASALGDLLSAARAAQSSQAAAALAASQAGSSAGNDGSGSGGGSGSSGSRYPTPTAEQLAAAAANQAAVNQQMVDAINNWVSQQPPVLTCAETPSCRGY